MSINIHGKQYITVAERLVEAQEFLKSITTEVLFQSPVVIKATVITDRGTFTGISAANPDKSIEKMSPYEVAETSAVGRALGFAGFGIVEGIATADEMVKVQKTSDMAGEGFPDDVAVPTTPKMGNYNDHDKSTLPFDLGNCAKCGSPNTTYKTGRVGCSKFCWRK